LGVGRSSRSYYWPVPVQPVSAYCVCPVYVAPACQAATAPPPFATVWPQPFAAPAAPPAAPVPQKAPIYARPEAAPPSSGPMPGEAGSNGLAPRSRASVTESRAYSESYPVAVQDSVRRFGDRCSIEFWNLTNKDVILKVDGQSRTLAQGKSLSVDVARRFTWQ